MRMCRYCGAALGLNLEGPVCTVLLLLSPTSSRSALHYSAAVSRSSLYRPHAAVSHLISSMLAEPLLLRHPID